MDLGLAGKVAVVSGGSKGVGQGIANALAAEGAKVVIGAREKKAIDDAVAKIRDNGGEAVGVSLDLSTREGVDEFVRVARQTYGGVDIAVSNVLVPPHKYKIEDCDDDDFSQTMTNLVMHTVWLTQAVVAEMKERGWGRLLNVGSIVAKEINPDTPLILSHSFRAGVVGLQKSLALELGPFGITANTLGIGTIKTDRMMWSYKDRTGRQDVTWEEMEALRSPNIPVRRMGTPEDCGALAAFLCSEKAGFITGQMYTLDGGVTRTLF
jgi:3-oxoacyl-[acyl-carrier protein] reductase